MLLDCNYQPIVFFLSTLLCTWIFLFGAAYFSYKTKKQNVQLLLMLLGILPPCVVAFVMLHTSSYELVGDFWNRFVIHSIDFNALIMIVLVIPAVFFLAIAISLLFGKSTKQFAFAEELQVMKGRKIVSWLIPFVVAPILEELGWRGYGVDSLRCYFNLFYTSLFFAFFWALWHLPLLFIKGYYHYELRKLNMIYVINFFVSLIPIAILFNWIYYVNGRNILLVIFVHAFLNILSAIFRIEQFTKCIVTILLCLVVTIVVFNDKSFFFNTTIKDRPTTRAIVLPIKHRLLLLIDSKNFKNRFDPSSESRFLELTAYAILSSNIASFSSSKNQAPNLANFRFLNFLGYNLVFSSEKKFLLLKYPSSE